MRKNRYQKISDVVIRPYLKNHSFNQNVSTVSLPRHLETYHDLYSWQYIHIYMYILSIAEKLVVLAPFHLKGPKLSYVQSFLIQHELQISN